MASNYLTTSAINNLVNSYVRSEVSRRVTPLKERKSDFQDISSAFDSLQSKLYEFKTVLSDLKDTTNSTIFNSKDAASSNENVLTASASSTAVSGEYSLRVNQLAKGDIAMSQDFVSSDTNGVTTGTHEFLIKTGDGSGGEYTSKISVDLDAADTNRQVLEKIQSAVNSDLAVVESSQVTGDYTGTAGEFTVNVDGEDTAISYNSGQTYDQIITDISGQLNDITGLKAEKITDGSNVQLKITVTDSSKSITIDQTSDTGELLNASNLNINVSNEKGASGIVNASVFSPVTDHSQLSISSKETGLDYRITELSDSTGGALAAAGLNFGTSRPTFDQSADPDTAGFVYSDTTTSGNQLNSKITFNGLNIQRNSNNVDDLIDGVDLSLKSVMESGDSDVSVNVDVDVEKIKGEIEKFVNKFNDTYKFLRNKTTYASGERGILLGDANSSSIMNKGRSFSYTAISGIPSEDINTLSELGITFDADSGLKIDDVEKLENNILQKTDEVENLFNSENGVAADLYDFIDPYLGVSGYLENSKSSYDSNARSLSDRITSIENSIDNSAANLRSRYEDLQAQLAQMQSSFSLFQNFSQGGFF